MDSIFCCSSIKPYRPRQLDYGSRFEAFMKWSLAQNGSPTNSTPPEKLNSYVVQIVRQTNFGPLESKRYFVEIKEENEVTSFRAVREEDLLEANYEKLNSVIQNPGYAAVKEEQNNSELINFDYKTKNGPKDDGPEKEGGITMAIVSNTRATLPTEKRLDGEERKNSDGESDGRYSPKDFTACDKECGYCGYCDY
ncbi:hypothetical protein B7463_g6779, partial [Scytalidium lignicola]